jgi:hypothetical protein
MTGPVLEQALPQSLEAEQATLGAMLMERDAIARVVGLLNPDDFCSPRHQILYRAMIDLFREGGPVDLVTLQARLLGLGSLETAGGRQYLIDLQDPAPTAAAVEYYASIVREKSVRRSLIEAAETLRERAHEGEIPALVTAATEAFRKAGERCMPVDYGVVTCADLMADTEDAQYLVAGALADAGLVVLAGEGGVGKGWITFSMAEAVDSGTDWLGQFATTRKGTALIIDYERGRRYQRPRVRDFALATGRVPGVMFLFRPPKFESTWLASVMEECRPALLIIDSLTHLLPEGVKDTDNSAMAEVLGKLRRIAEQYSCCVLVIHHFRKRANDGDNRPLARVRGATAIVDTADLVLAASRTRDGLIRVEVVKSYWPDAAQPFVCDWQSGEHGGTQLVYAGQAEPEKIVKIDEAREIILAALEAGPQTRERLDAACALSDIAKRTVSDALKALQNEDRVRRTMDHKRAVFSLSA